jgi:DNA-binding PadR family transcriptional regulator
VELFSAALIGSSERQLTLEESASSPNEMTIGVNDMASHRQEEPDGAAEAGFLAREADLLSRELHGAPREARDDAYLPGTEIRNLGSAPEEDPSPIACAVLAIIAAKGRVHAYEVVREVRQRGGVLGASESTIYRALKELSVGGYATAVKARKGDRLVDAYLLTDRGERALERWVLRAIDDAPDLTHAEVIAKVRAARKVPKSIAHLALKNYVEELNDFLPDLAWEERQARRDVDWDEVLELEYRLRADLTRAFLEFAQRARDLFDTSVGVDDVAADDAFRRRMGKH